MGFCFNREVIDMKKILTAFCLMFLFYSYSIGIPQTRKMQPSGTIWKTLTPSERTFYLGGLQEGTHELLYLRLLFAGSIPNTDPEEKALIKELKLTREQSNLFIKIINKRLNEIDLQSFGTDVIADVMTKIYDDPANTFIGFHEIAKIAVMMLQGKSEEEVRKELEISRRATAELMRTK
jgi:hypothetical protein